MYTTLGLRVQEVLINKIDSFLNVQKIMENFLLFLLQVGLKIEFIVMVFIYYKFIVGISTQFKWFSMFAFGDQPLPCLY